MKPFGQNISIQTVRFQFSRRNLSRFGAFAEDSCWYYTADAIWRRLTTISTVRARLNSRNWSKTPCGWGACCVFYRNEHFPKNLTAKLQSESVNGKSGRRRHTKCHTAASRSFCLNNSFCSWSIGCHDNAVDGCWPRRMPQCRRRNDMDNTRLRGWQAVRLDLVLVSPSFIHSTNILAGDIYFVT